MSIVAARIARITSLAQAVWEDPDLAREFLTSEQSQLGGKRPLDLAAGEPGARKVEALLRKLEFSLPV